jgi:hypothetical protein
MAAQTSSAYVLAAPPLTPNTYFHW